MAKVSPERFRIPSIKLYDGSTYPYDHVELLSFHMLVQSEFDAMWYRAFSATLGVMPGLGLLVFPIVPSTTGES